MTLASAHAVSGSAVVPGVLGFLVVAGLGVALFFLLRSMNKQLRKVEPPPPPRPARPGAATTATAGQRGGGASGGAAGNDRPGPG